MALKATRFVSLLLVALTLGMTFCHVMEIPGKLRLEGPDWLTVQHNLYVAFGVVGAAIEVLAILLTWVLVLQVRGRRPAFYWTLGAAGCVTAGLIVWFMLVAPMNAALSDGDDSRMSRDTPMRLAFRYATNARPIGAHNGKRARNVRQALLRCQRRLCRRVPYAFEGAGQDRNGPVA